MKSQKIIYQVDAFTDKPFHGNPAGVCLLNHEPSADWMQNVAMEMNLSETAFVFEKDGKRLIRFYTPASEVNLCGHATLSASHIMFEQKVVKRDKEIILSSKAGELRVRKQDDWITMNFPSYPLTSIEVMLTEFRKITGLEAVELFTTGEGWTLALMKDEEAIKKASPNISLMRNSKFGDLIITAPSSDPSFDFCVRCFAPALGIDEDPVTGSAHCALVPFWNERTGKKEFLSHQISKREGVLKVSLHGNRVEISGQALTVFKAELYV